MLYLLWIFRSFYLSLEVIFIFSPTFGTFLKILLVIIVNHLTEYATRK